MPQRGYFHDVDRERTPILEPISRPQGVETQQIANIDCTGP